MKVILLFRKEAWQLSSWALGVSFVSETANVAGQCMTFGGSAPVFRETYEGGAKDSSCLVFVHANDADRWSSFHENMKLRSIEDCFARDAGLGLLGVLPFTTAEGNAHKNGDVIYGSRAVRRFVTAVASGRSFATLHEIVACLDPMEHGLLDHRQTLAILCQGYILASVGANSDLPPLIRQAFDRIGWNAGEGVPTVLPERRAEVARRDWWTTVFSSRPEVSTDLEVGPVGRLLRAIWHEPKSSKAVDLAMVAAAYLQLAGE